MFHLLYVDQSRDGLRIDEDVASRPEVTIGFASDATEAVAQAGHCDVVLVSATLPGDGALEIVRAVAKARPDVRILVKDLAESNQPAAAYMEAGAAGWLL